MWRDPRKKTYDSKVKIYMASDWKTDKKFPIALHEKSVQKLIEPCIIQKSIFSILGHILWIAQINIWKCAGKIKNFQNL